MKVLGNKIYIVKGEDFTLKFGSQNVEPLVIPASYDYPFIVITLQSTVFRQAGQYTNVRWLDCKNVPKFTYSDIQYIGTDEPSDTTALKYVYCQTVDDVNEYFYYNESGEKVEYSLNFLVHYDTEESDELVDRKYFGKVTLVAGQPMSTYLFSLVDKYGLSLSEQTMTAAYNALSNINAKELDGLDVNRPLNKLTVRTDLLNFELYSEV